MLHIYFCMFGEATRSSLFLLFLILPMNTFATYTFPNTIEGFGYAFNENGELRKIDPKTGKPGSEGFQFNVRDGDQHYNQKHYEALGELMTDYVYNLLDKEGLERLPVPADAQTGELTTFFFATPGAFEKEFLLVLAHGSGVVRAGQWARSLIINDNLETGTQLAYIRKAVELGYGVVVLNTNDNYRDINKRRVAIRESDSPEAHYFHVWDAYVAPSKAKHIAIIAHSYGGQCTSYLSWSKLEDVTTRVFAVALTDSVHYVGSCKSREQEIAREYLHKIGRNWRASKLPLDTPLKNKEKEDIPWVSAGHPKHEMTSASAINSVFAFIEERRRALTEAPPQKKQALNEDQASVLEKSMSENESAQVLEEQTQAKEPASLLDLDDETPKTDQAAVENETRRDREGEL